ncbi:hypothetical protein CAAN1_01S04016 [[Candida] anglica]|uniref:Uncharacterized protein n=1 Tax=[Candida] anglica TaxID=148631 RepID=A0ABP0ELI1_9ASCO
MPRETDLEQLSRQLAEVEDKARTYEKGRRNASSLRDDKERLKYLLENTEEQLKLRESFFQSVKRVISRLQKESEQNQITAYEWDRRQESLVDEVSTTKDSIHQRALSKKEAEIENQRKLIKVLQRDIDKLSTVKDMEKDNKDLNEYIKVLLKEKKSLINENKLLTNENKKLKQTIDKGIKEKKSRNKILDDGEANNRLEHEVVLLREELQKSFEKVQQTITGRETESGLRNEAKNAYRSAQMLVEENGKLHERISLLEKEIKEVTSELNTTRLDLQSSEVNTSAHIETANTSILISKEDFEQAQFTNSELQDKITQLNEILQELRASQQHPNSAMKKYKALYAKRHENRIKKIKEKYQEEIKQLETLVNEVSLKYVESEQMVHQLWMKDNENQKLLQLKEEVIALDQELLSAYTKTNET